jgi:ankyrin repeat protein
LHYAASVEIAECLLDAGAELDALDDDHSSTAAQYLVGDNQNVCRYLIERGAKSDLLMAVALGDTGLVERHLETDPASIGMRVSQEWFPMIDTAKNGGHIYQWTLGFYLSAFDIARKHGHDAVLDILLRHAPTVERLMAAVWRGDRSAIDALVAAEPELVSNGNQPMYRQLADAARHNDIDAVRTMLSVGFPTDATGQHQATPLHFACFHGNRQMVAELLARKASITARDRDFGSTPLGWAVHGSMNGWPGTSSENHDDVVGLLLDAGAEFDPDIFPTGHDAIDSVLKSRLFPA